MTLPSDPKARKQIPIVAGVLNYFPDAIALVAECSRKSNEQHNPGEPMHWAKEKSTDEVETLLRHLIDARPYTPEGVARYALDLDGDTGVSHAAKVAWRALAYLQRCCDAEAAARVSPPQSTEPVPEIDRAAMLEAFQHWDAALDEGLERHAAIRMLGLAGLDARDSADTSDASRAVELLEAIRSGSDAQIRRILRKKWC